jgi:hypothetical protein
MWITVAAEVMDSATTVITPEAPVSSGVLELVIAFLMGGVLLKAIQWVAGWMDGKGKEWIADRFSKLEEKLDQNSVLAQIQADNAVLDIIKNSIPEVFLELTETLQKDIKDGKFDKVDWEGIGGRLWERTKPHIVGGKNDYLKNSSFEDGKAVAAMVVEKFFKAKKAEEIVK